MFGAVLNVQLSVKSTNAAVALLLLLAVSGRSGPDCIYLPLELALGTLEILEKQILACQLIMVWKVVNFLPVM